LDHGTIERDGHGVAGYSASRNDDSFIPVADKEPPRPLTNHLLDRTRILTWKAGNPLPEGIRRIKYDDNVAAPL
jgi:hypothetical protein